MLFDDEEFDPYDNEDEAVISSITPKGLNAPNKSTLMIGHEGVEKKLIKLINSKKMPHAIIFSGEEGIGKYTMAQRLARALLVYGVEDHNQPSLLDNTAPKENLKTLDVSKENPIFSQVASKGHPDLLTLERSIDPKTQKQKNEINVETARKVTPFLRMTSSNGGWRIVVINDANKMNRNAQNSILKILEEPPKNALLILVCSRLGAMIPTIRSRCRVLEFDPLSPQHFNELLKIEYGGDFSDIEKNLLLTFSCQSIGQAKEIIDKNSIETIQNCIDLLTQWPNIPNQEVHAFSDIVGRAGQEHAYAMTEKVITTSLEKIISTKAKSLPLDTPFNIKGLENIKNQVDGKFLIDLHAEIKEMFAQGLYANLDKRLVVINIFNKLNSIL